MIVARELTSIERTLISKLVVKECANYDKEYGCMRIDGSCYMLGKYWTGSYCKYFRIVLLPFAPALSATLTSDTETRQCVFCGKKFVQTGNWAYCSAICRENALRIQKRDHMRKKRAKSGKLPL